MLIKAARYVTTQHLNLSDTVTSTSNQEQKEQKQLQPRFRRFGVCPLRLLRPVCLTPLLPAHLIRCDESTVRTLLKLCVDAEQAQRPLIPLLVRPPLERAAVRPVKSVLIGINNIIVKLYLK